MTTMFPNSFLILAAISGCCYAQQSASEVVTDIKAISHMIANVEQEVQATNAFTPGSPVRLTMGLAPSPHLANSIF